MKVEDAENISYDMSEMGLTNGRTWRTDIEVGVNVAYGNVGISQGVDANIQFGEGTVTAGYSSSITKTEGNGSKTFRLDIQAGNSYYGDDPNNGLFSIYTPGATKQAMISQNGGVDDRAKVGFHSIYVEESIKKSSTNN